MQTEHMFVQTWTLFIQNPIKIWITRRFDLYDIFVVF